jgi:aminopeptidase N
MFAKIAGFELRYQMRNPIFWIAVIVSAAMAFSVTISQGWMGRIGVHKNAPYAIAQVYVRLSLLYMFVSAAFVANVVVRDDETGFGQIVRATRISKSQYLFGRFAGAFLATPLSFLSVPVAIWIGTLMPGIDPDRIGLNQLSAYLVPYLSVALPNLFLGSALLFSVATMARSMMATYVGVVAFLMLWAAATIGLWANHGMLAAYVDPFGFAATHQATRYWTMDELDRLALPMDGLIFWNRIVWIAVGVASLGLAYARFRFGERASRAARRRGAEAASTGAIEMAGSAIPKFEPRFDSATGWAQLRARMRLDMAQIFRSPAYAVLLAIGVFHTVLGLHDLNPMWGTPSLPVTRLMVDLLNGNFTFIPLIIATYYSSELVWRERDRMVHEIIGASAIPDWAYVVPKTLALALVLISTLVASMIVAMAIQLFHGYTQFEIAKYLLWYLLPNAVDFTLIAALAIFVQAVSPHKFVGWLIMLLFVVSRRVLPEFGLVDHLYTYAQGPAVQLSDMNGQGSFWIGAWSFRAYWAAFALILLVLSHALWRRGAETRLRPRLKRLPRRLSGPTRGVAAVALLAFAGLGTWCFVNTHVWNKYHTQGDDDLYAADLERQLLPYEKAPRPTLTMVQAKVELWPHQRKMVTSGMLDLVNRQAAPLSEVHLHMRDPDTKWAALAVSGARLAKDYRRFQYRIYRFAKPLAPGATAHIAFTTVRQQIGFRNEGNDQHLVDNGSFLANSSFLPTVGMDRQNLLMDPMKRRRYGLTPELRPAKLEDLSATKVNQFHGDWIGTDITVITDADQTPIAPGIKVADRTVNGRRTARFLVRTPPTQNFFAVLSARYQERHVRHGDFDLAVYYDAQHPRNVDRMLAASANALDIYQSVFGPYPFHHTRIVEFPAYATFATSFAGTFPYSEGFGFIADLSNNSMIDYTSQVVSHELAHQWWGNQVNGADMQGASMLTETLAVYSASIVAEKTRGRDEVRRFLQHELDTYLVTRGEAANELPLARVEGQAFVAYQKGVLVMHHLSQVLGEDRVNAALRRYLDRFRFRSAPYPRSLDLIAEFRKGASPAENRLITDLFEKIALYDIRAKEAHVRKQPDGRYETTLTVEAHKYYSTGKGKESETPLSEQIGFGLFASYPGWGPFDAKDLLALRPVTVRSGTQQIKFVTAAKPSFAGTDPYDVLIDRNSDDNIIATR